MSRTRILAAVIACLAALATGAPAFGGMAVAAAQTGPAMATPSAHCDHCTDCSGGKCMEMVDCAVPCPVSIPVVAAQAIELPPGGRDSGAWPAKVAVFTGEWPPPDPFPPRA